MQAITGYEVLAEVYASETSLVLRARRRRDDRPVILKVLQGTHPTPREFARFRHEYAMLSSLRLASVVEVVGIEQHQNSLFIVEEDFNESLRNLLGRHPFTLVEWLAIFAQVAAALRELHERHIVHKDINPSNILYDPRCGVCKLIDFGISALLSKNNTSQGQSSVLEGTLAYMPPEQTGRVNRGVDYRSDLYALGVTMYELLTGRLPFPAGDPVAMIHAQIAQVAPTAAEVHPGLPPTLSAIIAKLMAKAAEDRYQSAAGIESDLRVCERQFRSEGRIAPFAIGTEDARDVFYLPQRLYGREPETAALLAAFNEEVVGRASKKLLLVAGYSGTGKTSLVKEVHKPVTQRNGYFIEGKFEQYQRANPYSALKQAFTRLVDLWLAESDERLKAIAATLREALGDIGQVMINLVPTLQLVIGPQPDVPDLSGTEAQNRFNHVCRSFLRSVASREHPLVIFVDDLQWADLASLNLLGAVLTDSQVTHLLLIGAYRDNETPPSHPFLLMIEGLARKGVIAESITLGNLSEDNVLALCADALHASANAVAQFARLAQAKTLGNPFFLGQFLKRLHAEGWIRFNHQERHWAWDTTEIERQDIPDDVVRFVAARITTLDAESQRLLTLGACIGNTFTVATLAIISESTEEATRDALGVATAEGLLFPVGTRHYRFAHDRIQQAAYLLLADSPPTHLRIGRLLLNDARGSFDGDQLFAIVDQFHAGQKLLTDPVERLALAKLNQDAGMRAKASAAWGSAVRYLSMAAELLPPDAVRRHYGLWFSVHCELAWCLYFAGERERIEAVLDDLLRHAADLSDQVRVQAIRMEYHHPEGRYGRAVEIQKDTLRMLGVEVDGEPLDALLARELQAVPSLLGSRTIEDLDRRPEMTSPRHRAIMDVLMRLWTSAYLDAQMELVAWSSCKMTNISLKHGNCHLTAYGFMNYGFVCVAMLGQYDVGHRFGKVAIGLAERFDDLLIRGKVYLLFAVFVNHWRAPLGSSLEYSLKAFPLLVENGDWTYAGYCAEFLISDPTIWGAPCEPLYEQATKYVAFLRDNAPIVLDEFFRPACLNPLLQLLGKTRGDRTFDDDEFSEAEFLDRFQGNALALSYYYTVKLRSLYLFGYLDDAFAMIDKCDFVGSVALAQAKVPEVYFFGSLTLLASRGVISDEDWPAWEAKIEAYQARMATWADNSPANFQHKFLLVEAERARLGSRYWEALERYESAIQAARESGYIQNEALGHELAARFLIERGQLRMAAQHLSEARYLYLKWGAVAKVNQIARDHAALLAAADLGTGRKRGPRSTTYTVGEMGGVAESIDLISIVRASQSLASEIDMGRLLRRMMKIVTENAGADRSVLLMVREGLWSVRAEWRAGWEEVAVPAEIAIEDFLSAGLPVSLVQYCARKQEGVVLGCACREGLFTSDPYFRNTGMKSVLCVPFRRSGNVRGLLYEENSVTEDAFAPERLQLLNLLSSQILISIENAEFYARLEDRVARRTAELQLATERLDQISRTDPLTGLQNRRHLYLEAPALLALARRQQASVAVVILDIDHFKGLNDTWGHEAGDAALVHLAGIFRRSLRPYDLAIRLGGDEFALVMMLTNEEQGLMVAGRIRAEVERTPIRIGDLDLRITVSVGVYEQVEITDIDEAIRLADLALYEAKQAGRNRVASSQGRGLPQSGDRQD